MSEINVDTIKNAAGTREFFPCTAWVNFDGSGVVAINDSGNVSSITDNAVGDYTVNFATAMDNINYSPSIFCGGYTVQVAVIGGFGTGTLPTVSALRVSVKQIDSTIAVDPTIIGINVFGGIS